ncbi:hypothetical protein DFH29DRAFT_880632 [Suillus ampliporus]|nr:hypothetical protein DFH29DRAFT_880632 [Suillus ampliporus]
MPPATKCPFVSATSSSTIGDGSGDDNISTNKDEAFVFNEDLDDKEGKDAEEAYQQIKAFGDANRDLCKSLKKDEQTADLQTIFTEEKGHRNVYTGKRMQICLFNIVSSKVAFLPVILTLPAIQTATF